MISDNQREYCRTGSSLTTEQLQVCYYPQGSDQFYVMPWGMTTSRVSGQFRIPPNVNLITADSQLYRGSYLYQNDVLIDSKNATDLVTISSSQVYIDAEDYCRYWNDCYYGVGTNPEMCGKFWNTIPGCPIYRPEEYYTLIIMLAGGLIILVLIISLISIFLSKNGM